MAKAAQAQGGGSGSTAAGSSDSAGSGGTQDGEETDVDYEEVKKFHGASYALRVARRYEWCEVRVTRNYEF